MQATLPKSLNNGQVAQSANASVISPFILPPIQNSLAVNTIVSITDGVCFTAVPL